MSYKNARELVQLYLEGGDLTEEQEHVLFDTAAEHGQILDNVVRLHWFIYALAENLEALS
ncbi:MAG: hypothetical protein HC836_46900 [Richelia sp. RM2_1_2]|nr:hypothetical protein [Richelia sp. RM2_1_2]